MKKKLFMSQSATFDEVNLIIWMDARSLYLTCRILIYLIILTCLLSLNKKVNLEKIKSWGESRYFDFHKSLWHHPL